jgi:hypothetical protein
MPQVAERGAMVNDATLSTRTILPDGDLLNDQVLDRVCYAVSLSYS